MPRALRGQGLGHAARLHTDAHRTIYLTGIDANFSGRDTSDLLLRNSDSGGLQVYNINDNQITGSALIGTVGLDWQFSGVGHFSVPGESDLLLRNSSTGALQLYNIKNDQITGSESIGTVGVDWNLRVSLPSAPPARPTWFCATTTAALSKFTTSPTIN